VAARAFDKKSIAAGLLALTIAAPAFAVTPVDIFDDRKAKKNGFDIIYEARDLSLPQAVRDGLAQPRGDLALTKTRVTESTKRIKNDVLPYIKKAYWTEAKEQLRRQLGTLRFDLNTLAEVKPKAERAKAQALKNDFIRAIEETDLWVQKKDGAKAEKAFAKALAALDAVTAAVL